MKLNKKEKICLVIIILFSIISTLFTLNNDNFYKKEIMKINSIEIKDEEVVTNPFGFKERYRKLEIKGVITNGKNKGKEEIIKYDESYSSIVTEKYRKGDKVFISNHDIDTLKRDTYIVIFINIFIILMFMLAKFRGLITIVNTLINTLIFYFALELYFKGSNAKVLLGICKGKKLYDKREAIKKRDLERESKNI